MSNKIVSGEYSRTHVYSNQINNEPKYLFKVIGKKVASSLGKEDVLLDLGGASGVFCNYINSQYKINTICLDADNDLVELGRKRFSDVEFVTGRADDLSRYNDNTFNFVTSIGLIGIFDEINKLLFESVRVLKSGGKLFVCDHLNNDDIDVILRYKYSDQKKWNIGHNIHSKKTIKRIPRNKYPDIVIEFESFTLPFDLKKTDDPLRTWTNKKNNGERELRNGMGMVVDLQIMTVTKSN